MWRRPTESGTPFLFNIPPISFFVKSVKINIEQNKKPALSVRKEYLCATGTRPTKTFALHGKTALPPKAEDFNNFLAEPANASWLNAQHGNQGRRRVSSES